MGKVILFPGGPHGPRATVRFLPARPARQMRLPLPPADAREQESADLELRIRAAKAMSAQHEEWMTTDPARRHVHARRRRRLEPARARPHRGARPAHRPARPPAPSMNLEDLFDKETLVKGIARGVRQYLRESGASKHFGELLETLSGLHLLKEGLLTADQACRLLQISRRTFDRQVAEGKWRKEESLGYSEPRFWFHEIVETLRDGPVPGVGDLPAIPLNVVDLAGATTTGRRRRKPKQAA